MSWTPSKNLIGKKVVASTSWDLGPFGKLSAKTSFTVEKPIKPPKYRYREAVPMAGMAK